MSSAAAEIAQTIDRDDNSRQLVILSLASLCPILTAHAVTTATIEYDGSGDEGQVNDIALHDAEHKPVAMPQARCTAYHLTFRGTIGTEETALETALDRFAIEALESLHAGWENGEGALGSLVIDVATGVATLEHSTRFISIETECHELGV